MSFGKTNLIILSITAIFIALLFIWIKVKYITDGFRLRLWLYLSISFLLGFLAAILGLYPNDALRNMFLSISALFFELAHWEYTF
jgi:hypothetical protein